MKKRFIALIFDAESFIGNNSYDMLELATENGDYPAIKDYCRVVGHYNTGEEAFDALRDADYEPLVYDTVEQEFFN